MKPYYASSLDPANFLALFAFLFFLASTFLISKKLLLKDKFNLYFLISVYSALSAVFYLDHLIKIVPFFNDSMHYMQKISSLSENPSAAPDLEIGIDYALLMPSLLSGGSIYIYVYINIFFGLVSFFLLWAAWRNCQHNTVTRSEQRCFLILCVIYPVSAVYLVSPLKETYVMLAFSLLLFGLTKKSLVSFSLIASIPALLITRAELLVLLPIFLVIRTFFFGKIRKFHTLLLSGPGLFFLWYGSDMLLRQQKKIGITPESLEKLFNSHSHVKSLAPAAYPPVNWETYLDVAMYMPLAMLQMLVAPFPILPNDWDPSRSAAYSLDLLFVLCIYFLVLLNWRWFISQNIFWFLLSLGFLLPVSFYEFHITGAVRHRYIFILLLLPIASQLLAKKLIHRTLPG